jgi:hypothetical protein
MATRRGTDRHDGELLQAAAVLIALVALVIVSRLPGA